MLTYKLSCTASGRQHVGAMAANDWQIHISLLRSAPFRAFCLMLVVYLFILIEYRIFSYLELTRTQGWHLTLRYFSLSDTTVLLADINILVAQ